MYLIFKKKYVIYFNLYEKYEALMILLLLGIFLNLIILLFVYFTIFG